MGDVDVRVEELKLRMVIILQKSLRVAKEVPNAVEAFLAMRRTPSAAPGPHVHGGRPAVSEVIGKTM